MKKVFTAAILISLLAASCVYNGRNRIRGNGVIKSENRSSGSFTGINAGGSVDVYVKQDPAWSIRVETDENILPYVVVENNNGILNIHEERGMRLKPSRSVKVYVSGPSIKKFSGSGACDIVSENTINSNETISISLSGACSIKMDLNAPVVKADLSGAGTLALKGQTRDLEVDGSGSTDINCFGLLAENTDVSISGAGDAEVFASVKLDLHVSGAADIRYKGNAVVNKHISGAGSVTKVE